MATNPPIEEPFTEPTSPHIPTDVPIDPPITEPTDPPIPTPSD